jgi:hypothetical protein
MTGGLTMIDPNHPNKDAQASFCEAPVLGVPCEECKFCRTKRAKNARRQAAYRKRQALLARRQRVLMLTDEEHHYLTRILQQMRAEGVTPAMMRDKLGRLRHADI